MSFLQHRLLRLSAAATTAATVLAAGHAQANSCTFAAISANSCGTFSVGVLTFSDFTRAPGSGEGADTLTVSLLPNFDYLISSSYSPGPGFLTGNGSIGFKVTSNNPLYSLIQATANSDTSNGGAPPFTFTNTLTGIASPLVSVGAPVGPSDFASSTSTSDVTIAWTQGSPLNYGLNSSLRLRTNPAAPPTVPAPLPLLGAGGAFAFSRRLRRRLNQARLV